VNREWFHVSFAVTFAENRPPRRSILIPWEALEAEPVRALGIARAPLAQRLQSDLRARRML